MTIFITDTPDDLVVNVNKILAIAKMGSNAIEIVFCGHENHLPLYYSSTLERDNAFNELVGRMREATAV
jgi:hypothetical protein